MLNYAREQLFGMKNFVSSVWNQRAQENIMM